MIHLDSQERPSRIRPSIAFLVYVALILMAPETRSQVSVPTKIALVDRIQIAGQIYADIQTYFGHWRGLPNFNLQQEYESYLNEMLMADDRKQFDLLTVAFIARLRNGHSAFGDSWLWETDGAAIGFYAYPLNGRWTVTTSTNPNLRPGDVLTQIDGEDFEAFFQRNAKYISASDDRWLRRAFFEKNYIFPHKFPLTIADGRTVKVARSGKTIWPGDEYEHIEVKDQEAFTYIRIPSFAGSNFEDEAISVIKKLDTTKPLVLGHDPLIPHAGGSDS